MSYYSCFSCSKDKNTRHGTNFVDKCSTAYEELLDPNTPKKKALKQYNFLLSSCAHIYDYQKVEYAKNLRNELSKI